MPENISEFNRSHKCPRCGSQDTTPFTHGTGRFYFNCNKCQEKTEITDDDNTA